MSSRDRNDDIPLEVLRDASALEVLPTKLPEDVRAASSAQVGDTIASSTPARADSTDADAKAGDLEPSGDKHYPTGAKLYLMFMALSFDLILGGLDANIVATAVPSITAHFHTIADVGWYYSAYRLSACALQFPFGKLYAIYPTKWLIFTFNSIFLLGSVLCAAASSSAMFVLGRAVTGAGMAGSAAGFFILMMEVVPPQRRPVFNAVVGAVEIVSGVVAPVLGGAITENLSWRWCFWINLPIGGASLLALALFGPSSSKRQERAAARRDTWKTVLLTKFDIVGVLLLISTLVCLFIPLNWGGAAYSWKSPVIIGLFAASGVLATLLIVQQLSRKDPGILPAQVLKSRNVFPAAIFAFCVASTLGVVEYYAPSYFQAVHGYTPTQSGYLMLPSLIGVMLGVLVQGSGTSSLGYYSPFMLFSSIMTSIFTGLLTTWNRETGIAKLILYLGLAGFSAGIGCLCPSNSVTTALSRADAPTGISMVLFASSFGAALSVSIGQAIFNDVLTVDLMRVVSTSPTNVASGTNVTSAMNVTYIEHLGLADINHVYQGELLQEVTSAFSSAITRTWYLAVAMMCFSFVGSALLPWVSVKKKQQ